MSKAAGCFYPQIARRISHSSLLSHRWPIGRRSPLSIAHREGDCGGFLPPILLCRQVPVPLMSRAHRDTLCFRLDTVVHSCSYPLFKLSVWGVLFWFVLLQHVHTRSPSRKAELLLSRHQRTFAFTASRTRRRSSYSTPSIDHAALANSATRSHVVA